MIQSRVPAYLQEISHGMAGVEQDAAVGPLLVAPGAAAVHAREDEDEPGSVHGGMAQKVMLEIAPERALPNGDEGGLEGVVMVEAVREAALVARRHVHLRGIEASGAGGRAQEIVPAALPVPVAQARGEAQGEEQELG